MLLWKKSRETAFFLVCMLILSSCGDFGKIQRSENLNEKLEGAIRYYDKEDYYKAGLLLDEIVPLLKGQETAEKAQYYQAYTYYHQKDYLLSAYYFKEFYQTYTRSTFHQEAMYMQGKCLYMDSPRHNLDQTSTYDALSALDRFVNRYPYSDYATDANKMIAELEAKLEKKSYEHARLYVRIGQHKAAIIALRSFLKDYQGSDYTEEALYLIVQEQYNLAKKSVVGKSQVERYYEVMNYYRDFIDVYPQSRFAKPAESYNKNAQADLLVLKEKLAYLTIVNQYNDARSAVGKNKVERYEKVLSNIQTFNKEYQDSNYRKQIAKMQARSNEELQILNK